MSGSWAASPRRCPRRSPTSAWPGSTRPPGCWTSAAGPGILTFELVKRQGEANVSAVDPVEAFVSATAASYPAADVRQASAEDLPYPDDTFGATLAQLVVHFMSDPAAGVGEMARVTAPGGRVSACVWDHAGGTGALSDFWRVVQRCDPEAEDEGALPGSTAGDLTRLFTDAGLQRGRGDPADGTPRVRHLRGVVGAVHARGRPRRRLRPEPQPDRARRAGGRVARGAGRRPGDDPGECLDRHRPGVTRPHCADVLRTGPRMPRP